MRPPASRRYAAVIAWSLCWRQRVLLARRIGRRDRVGYGVTARIEETTATVQVPPAFGMHSLRVPSHVEEVRPGLIVEAHGIGGTGDMGLAAIGEFKLRAGAAIWTADKQHDRDDLGSVGYGGGGGFVDQDAVPETLDAERRIDRMRFVPGDGPGKNIAGARRGLETPGAPSAVQVKSGDRGLGNDRGTVRGYVDDTAPIAQHSQPPEHREEFADRIDCVVGDVERAALGIGCVGIRAGTDH